MKITSRQSGRSLVEILVALVIFSLIITAVTLVFFGGQNFLGQSVEARKAIEYAHVGLEAVRIVRDNGWTNLTDGIHGLNFDGTTWTLTGSPDVSNGYTRTVSISSDFDNVKHIRMTVQWDHQPEGTKTVEIYTTLSPLEQGISGDWTQPCILSTAAGSSGSSKGTDVVYANGKAYVTSNEASSGKPDFYIFDVSNTSAPALLSSLDVEQGLKSVSVVGNYAYVIEAESTDFFSIDISIPSAPVVKKKITIAGGAIQGRYVVARGNFAYVGTTTSVANDFYVVNISDPTNPVVAGSAGLRIGGNVNEISLLQNYAYLATSHDSRELAIVDLSSVPIRSTLTKTYDAPGTADGLAVHAKTTKLVYLGRVESSSPGNSREFIILDTTTNPPSARGSSEVSDDVLSIMSVQTLSFLGANDTNEELQAFYIRDPTAPVKWGGLNVSNVITGADYHANVVFAAVNNGDILNLITSMKGGICDD